MEKHSALLTVNLDAIAENYRICGDLSGGARAAAVVKADAYGLGCAEIAPTLHAAGCRDFFVATLGEALALRETLPSARIYLLDGLPSGAAEACREASLLPCLGSVEEIREWRRLCRKSAAALPAAWHMDSGMNRLGLDKDALRYLANHPDLAEPRPALLMSHFACADLPDHPMTAAQEKRFDDMRESLGMADIPASMANTAALIRGAGLHALTRPGVGLYGGDPFLRDNAESSFRSVLRFESFLTQIRRVSEGETIGYGADYKASSAMRIGVSPVGYADGLARSLWRNPAAPRGETLTARIEGRDAPILGRISMDMITIDLSALPEKAARRGTAVELLGETRTINDWARFSATIPHAILTGLRADALGKRAAKRYISSLSLEHARAD